MSDDPKNKAGPPVCLTRWASRHIDERLNWIKLHERFPYSPKTFFNGVEIYTHEFPKLFGIPAPAPGECINIAEEQRKAGVIAEETCKVSDGKERSYVSN